MENSICFGVFLNEDVKQVGFARVITDYATTYYICDVIIDSEYRGNGLGKRLLEAIESDVDFCDLKGTSHLFELWAGGGTVNLSGPVIFR